MEFFKRKNVVTIIASIICIIIIAFAYNYRVNKAISAQVVPVALETLKGRDEITSNVVGSIKVAASSLTTNVLRNTDDIVGHYVNYNTTIPKGSFFYSNAVVTWDEMPDSAWADIEDGNTIYALKVSSSSAYINSIYPGDRIDIYYSYEDEGKKVVGQLIAGVKILAIKDTAGNHIRKKTAEQKEASALLFSVTEAEHLLLRRAAALNPTGLIPVPRNAEYSLIDSNAEVTSQYLVNLINSNVIEYAPEVINDESILEEITEEIIESSDENFVNNENNNSVVEQTE